MKHECGLCLRDNNQCKNGNSLIQILFGKVKDCSIYNDYHKGLKKQKQITKVRIGSKKWRKK